MDDLVCNLESTYIYYNNNYYFLVMIFNFLLTLQVNALSCVFFFFLLKNMT